MQPGSKQSTSQLACQSASPLTATTLCSPSVLNLAAAMLCHRWEDQPQDQRDRDLRSQITRRFAGSKGNFKWSCYECSSRESQGKRGEGTALTEQSNSVWWGLCRGIHMGPCTPQAARHWQNFSNDWLSVLVIGEFAITACSWR
jgi:hypothetical protein